MVVVSHIKVTDVIEHVRRSTLNMTNLNTLVHKRKGRSRLYHSVEKVFVVTVCLSTKLAIHDVNINWVTQELLLVVNLPENRNGYIFAQSLANIDYINEFRNHLSHLLTIH